LNKSSSIVMTKASDSAAAEKPEETDLLKLPSKVLRSLILVHI